jgi:hypothetical protein
LKFAFESLAPIVDITIDLIAAAVAHNGAEDELVLTADISP